MFSNRGAWLGQVPLVLGPSSWGAGMTAPSPRFIRPTEVPPYFGQWGVVDEETGKYTDGGQVGPFPTSEEAFQRAAEEASAHGARRMPLDGFAQVVDSRGQPAGSII